MISINRLSTLYYFKRWGRSLADTSHSNIFETADKFDIGLKWDGLSWSKPGVFNLVSIVLKVCSNTMAAIAVNLILVCCVILLRQPMMAKMELIEVVSAPQRAKIDARPKMASPVAHAVKISATLGSQLQPSASLF